MRRMRERTGLDIKRDIEKAFPNASEEYKSLVFDYLVSEPGEEEEYTWEKLVKNGGENG